MSDDAVIKVGVDGTDAVAGLRQIEEASAKTGRKLDELGNVGGFKKVGEGAEGAAGKMDKATKNLEGSLQRTIAAFSAGEKGSAAYFAALGKDRGADVAKLKPLLDQLDEVTKRSKLAAEAQKQLADKDAFLNGLKARTDAIGKSASELAALRAAQLGVSDSAGPMIAKMREAEEAASKTGSSFNKSRLALIAFSAVAAGGALFVGMTKGVIDTADGLNDLSKSTGVAVADLAGLSLAAKQSGGDLAGIADSINKLSVNIGKDGEKFAKLGVTAKEPLEAFKQLADIFAAIDDPQTRARLGADALGKSWASAAPLLAEGGAKIGELVDKGRALSGMTQGLADEADAFNDKLAEVSATIEGFKTRIVADMLPGLSNATSAIKAAYEESGKLQAVWTALGAFGAFIFTDEFASAAVKVKNLREQLPQLEQDLDLATNAPAVGYVGRALFGESKEALEEKIRSIKAEIKSLMDQANPPAPFADPFGDKFIASIAKYKVESALGNEKADAEAKKRAAAIEAEQKAYSGLVLQVNERIAASKREAEGLEPLTESQKLQATLTAQLAAGNLKLSASHIGIYEAKIKELSVQEALAKARKDAELSALALAKIQADYASKNGKAVDDANKEADAAEELARTYGLTKAAIAELTIKRMEDRVEVLRGIEGADDEVAALELVIAAKKRAAAAGNSLEAKQATQKQNEFMLSEWNKTVEKYNDVFRTGFADMLNNGRDGWKSFTRSLVTTFKTTVADQIYKMFAQPFVMRLVASLIGVTGGGAVSSVANAATGQGGGLGGIVSVAQSAKSAYEAISSGFAGIGESVAGGVQAFQTALGSTYATAAGSQQSLMLAAQDAGFGAVGGAGSTAGLAGTAASYLGGAAVGVYGGRALSNGYSAIGSGSGNTAVNVGTIAGAILGGPIGAAIGGLIGGAVNRLFGRKEKEITSTTLNGGFGLDGAFSGTTDQAFIQKGGVFRSDKTGVDKTAIDAGTAKQFGAAYEALKFASADFAKTLGINADSIATRAQSLSIALTKDQAANEKAIADFFVGVGDTIAKELLPTIADFAKEGESASGALQRIATNYAFVDAALNALGVSFGAVGVDSISARERLVELSGGLESFGKGAAYFAQNFLTEAERLAPVAKTVEAALAALDLSGVDTREQFKEVVLGLDLTTESGAKTYASLIGIAEQFALLHPVVDQVAVAVSDTTDAMADAVAAAKEAQAKMLSDIGSSVADSLTRTIEAAKNLRAYSDSLLTGSLSALDAEERYQAAKKQFLAAKPTDTEASSAYLQAAKDRDAGDFSYSRDFAAVIEKAKKGAIQLDKQAEGIIRFWQSFNLSPAVPTVTPLAPIQAMQQIAPVSNEPIVKELQLMRETFAQALAPVAASTAATADVLDRVTAGGSVMLTEAAA